MEAGPDIVTLDNGATWTLRAGTERGFKWLREYAGTDEREIELEASHARELGLRAHSDGLIVSSDF